MNMICLQQLPSWISERPIKIAKTLLGSYKENSYNATIQSHMRLMRKLQNFEILANQNVLNIQISAN